MNDLASSGLDKSSHNINTGVMTIEQSCRGKDPDIVFYRVTVEKLSFIGVPPLAYVANFMFSHSSFSN
jgi:hypothetical protein